VAVTVVQAERLARVVLASFVFTFIGSRTLVLLIMSGRVPDLYMHVGGTHIHHLNYGIFLLAAVGGYLLFAPTPRGGRGRRAAAIGYGVGLALTFDEFGMWLYLQDVYWQRASFDAIIVITAVLGLAVLAPRWRALRPRHWATAAALGVTVVLSGVLLRDSLRYANRRMVPLLEQLQQRTPR
jgi:hypothetical protein